MTATKREIRRHAEELRALADWWVSAEGVEEARDKGLTMEGIRRRSILTLAHAHHDEKQRGFDLIASAITCLWAELDPERRDPELTTLSRVATRLKDMKNTPS